MSSILVSIESPCATLRTDRRTGDSIIIVRAILYLSRAKNRILRLLRLTQTWQTYLESTRPLRCYLHYKTLSCGPHLTRTIVKASASLCIGFLDVLASSDICQYFGELLSTPKKTKNWSFISKALCFNYTPSGYRYL